MDFSKEVEATVNSTGEISKSDYVRWSKRGNLATRGRVYALAASQWSRIQPEPQMSEHCAFMADYLLECLLTNPPADDYLHSGFDAAHELAAWLKHLAKDDAGRGIVADVAHRLATAYRASDARTRNRIETGALEHALESPRVRPFFSAWEADPILREAYGPALQWGLAHSEETG